MYLPAFQQEIEGQAFTLVLSSRGQSFPLCAFILFPKNGKYHGMGISEQNALRGCSFL